jgi:hypothetical protein
MGSGILAQAVILMFVIAGNYYHDSAALRLGGIALLGLLMIQSVAARIITMDAPSTDKDRLE